jgi:hypothetical protein
MQYEAGEIPENEVDMDIINFTKNYCKSINEED